MAGKTRRVFQAPFALAILFAALLACSFFKTERDDYKDMPRPDNAGTMRAPLVPMAWFVESDCPTQGLSGLTFNGSAGVLDCSYHWNGKFGANNVEMRIFQYLGIQYQQILSSDLQYRQAEIAKIKTDQTGGSKSQNANLDIIQEDDDDIIYMETYNGRPTTDNPEFGLCGNGWGTMGVHGEFVVTLQLTESCDISTSAFDYSQVMTSLKNAAVAAISRAEKNMTP